MIFIFLVCRFVLSSVVQADEGPAHGSQVTSPHSPVDSQVAIAQFRKELASQPYSPIPKFNLAVALMRSGVGLLKQKKYEEAVAQFIEAEVLLPDDPQPLFLHGNALYLLKQYDEARIVFDKARGLGGDTTDILFFLGKIAYDSDDIVQAVELWGRAVQLDPGNKGIEELLTKARRELQVDAKMGKGHSSRFILSYDTGVRPDVADQVLDALEDAYNRVGRNLGSYPEARVPVILYTGRDYRDITGSPDWSGGQYDGKIRLPVGGLSQITSPFRAILFHEYTHVVVYALTKGNCPVWLNEGLAEIEGRKEHDPPLVALNLAVSKNTLLPIKTLSGSFASLAAHDVSLAYQQSYSLTNYLVSTYGWHLVSDLLQALGHGSSFDEAMTQAYADVGRSFADIFAEWRQQVVRDAGRYSHD